MGDRRDKTSVSSEYSHQDGQFCFSTGMSRSPVNCAASPRLWPCTVESETPDERGPQSPVFVHRNVSSSRAWGRHCTDLRTRHPPWGVKSTCRWLECRECWGASL